jgi:hypothetical protein
MQAAACNPESNRGVWFSMLIAENGTPIDRAANKKTSGSLFDHQYCVQE